jgi:septum formation protein
VPAPCNLILASSSPRRQALLKELGLPFEICAADSDGPVVSSLPGERVAGHALFKAQQIAAQNPGCWVLSGDTLVYGASEFFEKPRDKSQARRMLQRLEVIGEHRVYTACCLISPASEVFQHVDSAKVAFQAIPAGDLETYLNGDEWRDKAGSYAIQGWAAQYASCAAEDFETIVGMSKVTVKKLFVESGFQYPVE